MSMSDQLPMFDLPTSPDTPNATSSPESVSGATLSGSQAGQMKGKPGPAPVPANPSARPAKAKRSTMKGIFGQSGFHSSKHEDLSFALANRLRRSTDSLGSTLFSLTWMTRVTPAGRSISALRASEPLTEGSVFIGWPTPTTEDHKNDGPKSAERMNTGQPLWSDLRLRNIVNLAGWPTGTATDGERSGQLTELMSGTSLTQAVRMAGWPTTRAEDAESSGTRHTRGIADTMTAVAALSSWASPQARDWKSGETSQETLDKNTRSLSEQAKLSGWATPTACTPNSLRGQGQEPETREAGGHAVNLQDQVRLAGWATPKVQAGEYQYGNADHSQVNLNLSGQARLTAFGDQPIGFLLGPNGWEIVPASGQLSAAHSGWLMGLPSVWDDCGVTAMELLRKPRKRS